MNCYLRSYSATAQPRQIDFLYKTCQCELADNDMQAVGETNKAQSLP